MLGILILRPREGRLEEALVDEARVFRHYVRRGVGNVKVLLFEESGGLWLVRQRPSRWDLVADLPPSEDMALYSPVNLILRRRPDLIDRVVEVWAKRCYEGSGGFRPWFEEQTKRLHQAVMTFKVTVLARDGTVDE